MKFNTIYRHDTLINYDNKFVTMFYEILDRRKLVIEVACTVWNSFY